ncbi:MAG: glycoside hydrolase family 3 protein [Spirochaetes bacterium]|nr:glycoside hydrolase family 3 protein [Spirochaetota bacterium]MBU1081199.1 glycoside hydrolase family 3 protein [Spirochaetota bacterium]
MIDLTSKPFNLDEAGAAWVRATLAGMDLRAKVGQLFCLIGMTSDEAALKGVLDGFKPGGVMYRAAPGAEVRKAHAFLQDNSELPLLVAANLEAGGDGIATDGTSYGNQMQVAATDDEETAYRLGLVAGREGAAVGCNWAFAPVIDIDYNFQNPITNTRTYGSDPERVLRMAKACMRGIHECGLAVSIKHFPGDGVDSRDQHLLPSSNDLSAEDWDASYGMVYRGMIEAGAATVMSAHITQPAYTRKLRPGTADGDVMPASLAPELLGGLLRKELGFKGLVTTDATIMAGFTQAGDRSRLVPLSIAAGNDMFLFTQDLAEDFGFMMAGVESGILSPERLDEAVTRVLALKASLRLHEKQKSGTLVPPESALAVLGCAEHRAWARECADKSVTLVKDGQGLLPLSPAKHRRIKLFVLGDRAGLFGGAEGSSKRFVRLLEARGFEVSVADTSKPDLAALFRPVKSIKDECDLVLYYANLKTASNQTTVRIEWAPPMGLDLPRYLGEAPVAFVSVANPYHLLDVPRVKTFVNAYGDGPDSVAAVVEKLVGASPFVGKSPVDPFCGRWDARL